MIPQDFEDRTPWFGYGTHGIWQGLNVDAMVVAVSEGHCPACQRSLCVETLLTFNHRKEQNWGCCHCCSRAWRLEESGDVKATACRIHEAWTCIHPLPGGTWTPAGHAASFPAVMGGSK